jgi:hypothetical protein
VTDALRVEASLLDGRGAVHTQVPGRLARTDLVAGVTNSMANTIRHAHFVKTLAFASLSLLFLASVCTAQQSMGGTGGGQKGHRQKADKTETRTAPKADEKAYNAALKSLPNKPYDPWFGTR